MPEQYKPGDRTDDFRPISHPNGPMTPGGPFAPRPPQQGFAPQAAQPQAPQGSEPSVVVDASVYLQQATAPMQMPAAPQHAAQGSQPIAAARKLTGPTATPKKRPPVVEAMNAVFGIQRVPSETYVMGNDDDGNELTVTLRPLGKEDQVWAVDMAASFEYETAQARDRAFSVACAAMSVCAMNGKPLHEALEVDVSGFVLRDPLCPPTAIRYRCATQLFYMVEGEGADALAPIFADLLLEHYQTFTDTVVSKYRPFYSLLQGLRAARAELERLALSQSSPSAGTSNSEDASQGSSAQP